jgi:TrpR-related protein YerC/YecD
MTNWHNNATDRLARVFAQLKTSEECYRFLEDLCTIREIMDMSQRLEVAILLKKGTNYQEINKKTGVSTATISRVNKCLSYGTGGYEEAICSLGEEIDENL